MNCMQTNKKLVFEKEVLQARIAIRDFHAKEFTRNIYENVGQVLSTVRMQLGQSNQDVLAADRERSGELVASSITELRHLSKHLTPDAELEKASYLAPSLLHLLAVIDQHPTVQLSEKEGAPEMNSGTKLIAYRLIQHIFSAIIRTGNHCQNIKETYHLEELHLSIKCIGAATEVMEEIYDINSSFPAKYILDLLNASLEIDPVDHDHANIFLKIPLNLPYE